MAERKLGIMAAALLALGLAACQPTFEEGAEIGVSSGDESVLVTWPEAVPFEESPISYYELWVGSDLVAVLDATERDCDIAGLVANETYEVTVKATDEETRGSPLLTTTIVAPAEATGGGAFCAIGMPPIEF